jgi:hypothetical protein
MLSYEFFMLAGVEVVGEVRWRACDVIGLCVYWRKINQGKVLVLDLYLQSTKIQSLMQVIMNDNRSVQLDRMAEGGCRQRIWCRRMLQKQKPY